jgi:glycosyltransferase involved in cell wall biosynthesis
VKLSALVVIHNEEARLGACLDRLGFADEIVVVLDRCTDRSREIALAYGARIVEGAWEQEGVRRNAATEACSGDWIVEVDADEHVPPELGAEIRRVIETSSFARHLIPIDNWVGDRLVRYGWGASFGRSAHYGLYRRGTKRWSTDRGRHPKLEFTGEAGPMLKAHLTHYLDRDISDMLRRFDRYTSAMAEDLRTSGKLGSSAGHVRRIFSRFWKCYVRRQGWREGGMGALIAILAGLYPYVSYLKAKYDSPRDQRGPS